MQWPHPRGSGESDVGGCSGPALAAVVAATRLRHRHAATLAQRLQSGNAATPPRRCSHAHRCLRTHTGSLERPLTMRIGVSHAAAPSRAATLCHTMKSTGASGCSGALTGFGTTHKRRLCRQRRPLMQWSALVRPWRSFGTTLQRWGLPELKPRERRFLVSQMHIADNYIVSALGLRNSDPQTPDGSKGKPWV